MTTDTSLIKISGQLDSHWSPEDIGVIRSTVAKGITTSELCFFLNVAKSAGLNPFNKEIWCYKDGRGNLIVFAGRDGFLKKAQSNPLFNGIRSAVICENDEHEIDIPNGIIHHKIKFGNRGKILGAYAIVYRKDGESTIELAAFDAYNRNNNIWKKFPESMIKKVAESAALKKAMGITGISSEHDFEVKAGKVEAIDTTFEVEELSPDHESWEEAKKSIKEGNATIDQIKKHYFLSEENELLLCSSSK